LISIESSRLRVNVSYDGGADVLYLTFEGREVVQHVPCRRGLLYGLEEGGAVGGLTLMDASAIVDEEVLDRLGELGVEGLETEALEVVKRFPNKRELTWWSVDLTPLLEPGRPGLRLEFRDYKWAEEAGQGECDRCVKDERRPRCISLAKSMTPTTLPGGEPSLLKALSPWRRSGALERVFSLSLERVDYVR